MPPVLSDDYFVQSRDIPTCKLFVRRRLRADLKPESVGQAVLFVHGTALLSSSFDCSASQYSWQEFMAERGFAAYSLELRGYGRSKVAVELPSKPFCRAEEAARDIGDVVEFIKGQTAARQILIVGFSWGTITAPVYAIKFPESVSALVLVAPLSNDGAMARTPEEPKSPQRAGRMYGRGFEMLSDPNDPQKFDPAIGAYIDWSITDIASHSRASMNGARPELWSTPEVDKAARQDLADALNDNADILRGPSGAAADLFDFYVRKCDLYEPEAVDTPTLIVRGELDFASTHEGAGVLLKRIGHKNKHLFTFGNGGHNIFFQKCAPQVFHAVYGFAQASR